MFTHILVLSIALMMAGTALAQTQSAAASRPIKMVVLGDSLSAGLGLSASEAFPERLQKALNSNGITVEMTNAGVSGDTSSDGRDRLDWSVPDGTDAVIVELGANDALRGTDPAVTRSALSDILARLKARGIAVCCAACWRRRITAAIFRRASMRSIRTSQNPSACRSIHFSCKGVAADASLNQADGIHPTAAGVDVIVRNILPTVQAFLGTISRQRS